LIIKNQIVEENLASNDKSVNQKAYIVSI